MHLGGLFSTGGLPDRPVINDAHVNLDRAVPIAEALTIPDFGDVEYVPEQWSECPEVLSVFKWVTVLYRP